MEPDYASFLIHAEKSLAKVYPCMADRKIAQALIHILEAQEAMLAFQTWVLQNKAK